MVVRALDRGRELFDHWEGSPGSPDIDEKSGVTGDCHAPFRGSPGVNSPGDPTIRAFFDSVPHDLLLKAVAHHTDERWVLLYIARWLKAPMQMPDGTLAAREKGTPQGSPISPLLANLFMHYAFDMWMVREYPGCPFERYADDMVAHCNTEGGPTIAGRYR